MKVGIHFEPNYNFSVRFLRYENILKFNQIEATRISSNDSDFLEKAKLLDAIVWYVGLADVSKQPFYDLLPVLENELNVNCFPSYKAVWSFDNKLRQIHQMNAKGYPIVKSWVAYEKDVAFDLIENVSYPVIFKLSSGAGSLNVVKLNSKKEAKPLVKRMFSKGVQVNYMPNSLGKNFIDDLWKFLAKIKAKLKNKKVHYTDQIKNWKKQSNYLLLQEYLPNNNFDTRVTTIGNRAFSFRRFNRHGDFRSSGSGLIDYNVEEIDLRCVKKALEISKHFQFETMAYDFLFDKENRPVFCEYSYGYSDEAVFKCEGYWDENLNFVKGNYWPQYFHLMDLLDLPNLQQPDSL